MHRPTVRRTFFPILLLFGIWPAGLGFLTRFSNFNNYKINKRNYM